MKLAIALCLALTACSRTDSKKAEDSAREYMRNIPNATGVACAQTDTDGDGYVSCTVFRGTDEPMQIQCGSEKWCVFNCATGCKYEPSVKFNGRRQSAP